MIIDPSYEKNRETINMLNEIVAQKEQTINGWKLVNESNVKVIKFLKETVDNLNKKLKQKDDVIDKLTGDGNDLFITTRALLVKIEELEKELKRIKTRSLN